MLYLAKFSNIITKGYVTTALDPTSPKPVSGFVKNLTDYFGIPKPDDIWMVYNGT